VYVESGYPHPHGGGGAGSYVQLVGRELVKRGYQISVVATYCRECGEEQDDLGVQVYRPKFTAPLHWYLSRVPVLRQLALAVRSLETGWHIAEFINRLHRRQAINLIEYSDGGNVWLAFRHMVPYVVHLHGSRYTFLRKSNRPLTWGDWLDRQMGLWCICRADQIISPSLSMLEEVQFEANCVFPNAMILPYPLDPLLLTTRNHISSVNNDRDPRIFFAARNDPVKGGDILLQAVHLVQERIQNVEFYFYGYQPKPEDARVHGVVFLPFLPKDQLMQAYAAADICITPSLWDNSPNTIYEAMAAGKPVIASRAGGIPELVLDHQTGLLVEPRCPKQLAIAIIDLLEHPERRTVMGLSARNHIKRIAGSPRNIEQRIKMYSRVSGWKQ